MLSATGRTRLPVRNFCPPPVILSDDYWGSPDSVYSQYILWSTDHDRGFFYSQESLTIINRNPIHLLNKYSNWGKNRKKACLFFLVGSVGNNYGLYKITRRNWDHNNAFLYTDFQSLHCRFFFICSDMGATNLDSKGPTNLSS